MIDWEAFAPEGWAFAATNEAALSHGYDRDPAPESGFLSAYGATNAENDFNTYAEKIFTDPKPLLALACKQPLVRRKLEFVLKTYITLDPRMDPVFRELGFDRFRLCEH